MKFLALIAGLGVTVFLLACGSGSDTTASARRWPKTEAALKETTVPDVPIPTGTPPKKLVVKEFKRGTGPVVEKGDDARARYVNIDYRTGEIYEDAWSPPNPTEFRFGNGEVLEAWDRGMRGMRVGGRRELIVPATQSYGKVPQIYVIELISAKGESG